jgi:predicted ATPase/FtsP/CotA-like multicopper oxidase with cupredoxin domain
VAPGEDVSGLEDEYRLSHGMPRLLYVKTPAPEREPRLTQLLRQIQDDDTASYRPFRTPEELAQLVAADLALLLSEQFTRSPLPTGAVTFLAAETVEAAALRRVVTAHRGFPLNAVTGIVCAAFARPTDAVSAAADLRRTVAADGTAPLRVALHSAAAEPDGDGYPMLPLERLTRMLAAGHAGQVLLSAAVVDLLDDAPTPPTLRPLGRHRLAENGRAEEIHQLDVDGLPADFPPLRTVDRPRHNLPVQLSSFIGRDHELADVRQAVARSRLTTLTGIGGGGKSRLALQAAADLVAEFPDGVWLAELAPLTEPERTASAVAAVLDIREEPQRTTVDTLVDGLRGKDLLLVLDNCEHVLTASAELAAALLRAAPGVRILATSREALAVPGEAIIPVPSLRVPPRGTDSDELVGYPAVRLFADRARAVRPEFAVSAGNAEAVTQIVTRLDGIPLALELAAARVKMLSVEQIATRLSDQFRLLRGGPRTSVPRQQTLRAAMDWSHDLLAAPEQALLRRLSVFAGGFTVEAAETVCAGGDIDPDDILDLLARLVDKSLVTVISGAGENRYRLLETVRQYATERLDAADETITIRDAHRDWCRTTVETAARHVQGDKEQTDWLRRLDVEHDNLQAALQWSVERGDATDSLRMTTGAAWFWYLRGHWDTALQWLDQSAALPGGDPTLRARAGAWAAIFAWKRGDLHRAETLADASLDRLAGSRDEGEGLSLLALTLVALSRTQPDTAQTYGRRTLDVFRARQHTWGVTTSLLVLARIASTRGSDDLPALLDESASLLTAGTDAWGRAHVLTLQGNEALRSLDLPRATQLHTTSHAIATDLGDRAGQAESLLALGHTALLQGDTATAERYVHDSRTILDQLDDPHYLAHADQAIALLAIARGDITAGEALLDDVTGRFTAMGKQAMGSAYAIGMADIYRRGHHPHLAAALLRHALSLTDKDTNPTQYARVLTLLQEDPVDHHSHHMPPPDDTFPQETANLPDAVTPPVLQLDDNAVLSLRIGPVRNQIGDHTVRMLAYNGSIPGPLLHVRQGSEITVDVTNDADLEQTVHWHGLRLDNRYDGVPYETQKPIAIGEQFTYRLTFPDPGLYWYHPHVREDYAQEMGLYGQIIVEPADPGYWPPANRDIALTLDDILLTNDGIPAFHHSGPTHTMMGRYGTALLVNGQTEPTFDVARGDVVRLYLTNTANTRIFNVAITGATLKLIGGDSGRYEREQFVDSIVLAPSERAIVDVLFDTAGPAVLEHRTPGRTSTLASFTVAPTHVDVSFADAFRILRTSPELAAERATLGAHLDRDPDKTLVFAGEMNMGHDMGGHDMSGHDMGHMDHHDMGHAEHPDVSDGIEWEDTMPEMNLMSDRSNMSWKIVDTADQAVNHAISWTFHVGDRVKIRLDNSTGSDHEMHHPFHIHGAGRFLILARDGAPEANLVWKDTVLVRAGEVVDILFDVTHPGRWMAHCHIAEHNESGMMFNFDVLSPTVPAEVAP